MYGFKFRERSKAVGKGRVPLYGLKQVVGGGGVV